MKCRLPLDASNLSPHRSDELHLLLIIYGMIKASTFLKINNVKQKSVFSGLITSVVSSSECPQFVPSPPDAFRCSSIYRSISMSTFLYCLPIYIGLSLLLIYPSIHTSTSISLSNLMFYCSVCIMQVAYIFTFQNLYKRLYQAKIQSLYYLFIYFFKLLFCILTSIQIQELNLKGNLNSVLMLQRRYYMLLRWYLKCYFFKS